jgi:hypothetical protein
MKEYLCKFATNRNLLVRISEKSPKLKKDYLEPLYEAKSFGPDLHTETFFDQIYNKRTKSIYYRAYKSELDELHGKLIKSGDRLQVFRDEQKHRAAYTIESLITEKDIFESSKYCKMPLFHSDFDFGKKLFSHMDHSLLIYEEATYSKRVEKGDKEKVKAEGHYKLFYISDPTLEEWIEASQNVFYDSELLHHFLYGKEVSISTFLSIDSKD